MPLPVQASAAALQQISEVKEEPVNQLESYGIITNIVSSNDEI